MNISLALVFFTASAVLAGLAAYVVPEALVPLGALAIGSLAAGLATR